MLQGRSSSLFYLLPSVHPTVYPIVHPNVQVASEPAVPPKSRNVCFRIACKCCVIVALLLLLAACSLSAGLSGAPAGFAEPTAISNAKDHLTAKWQDKLSQTGPSNSVLPSVWEEEGGSAQSIQSTQPDSSFNQQLNRDLAVTIDVNELPASQILEQLALEKALKTAFQ